MTPEPIRPTRPTEPRDLIGTFRSLRKRCERLQHDLTDDLVGFMAADQLTFQWLPETTRVSIASTCTCLMTAIAAEKLADIYSRKGDEPSGRKKADALAHDRAQQALAAIFAAEWVSSGLENGNPFTATIVARTVGVFARHNVGTRDAHVSRTHKFGDRDESLADTARRLATGIPDTLSVNGSVPHPTLAYWIVDATDSLDIRLSSDDWLSIAQWAASTFVAELSRVVSRHDALMDPVALAMAACLCRRIQRIAAQPQFEASERILSSLPSVPELQYGIRMFLGFQGRSGIWPKYFPLFYYAQRAANYCFTFEILEAIIDEFGDSELFLRKGTIERFDRALRWCEQNRLRFATADRTFTGWNSGGDRSDLKANRPEVWATGTVHLFATKFEGLLQRLIQKGLLDKYRATPPGGSKRWNGFIDVTVTLPVEGERGVKEILQEEVIAPVERSARPARRSGLLFGPPGTSKTSLIRALAGHLGWFSIEITPSDFLRGGLEKIYVSAEEIFTDLAELSQVVILFDEMDALVQRRTEGGAPRLDVTQQFLTTSMLPHLAKLHERDQVVFFMATNHQRDFDQAIKRPGRFDLLLCIAPPKWAAKKERIELFCDPADADAVRDILTRWFPTTDAAAAKLDVFTFDEIKALFEAVRRKAHEDRLSAALAKLGNDEVRRLVDQWHEQYITLRPKDGDEPNPLLVEFEADRKLSHLQ